MFEAPSHLIRIPGGVRVLRLAADTARCYPLAYTVRRDQAYCRMCGCTARFGCIGRCGWADTARTICTRCAEKVAR